MTPGEIKILTAAALSADGSVTVLGEQQMRIAERLMFRKFVTIEGSFKITFKVNITDAGCEAYRKTIRTTQSTQNVST